MVGRILRNGQDIGKWLVGTGNRNMRVVGMWLAGYLGQESPRNMAGQFFRTGGNIRKHLSTQKI